MKLKLGDVLTATQGRLLGTFHNLDADVPALVTYSRPIDRPALFAPFRGTKNDGHDFIGEALSNGCVGCLTERELPEYKSGKMYILVDNVMETIWKIALLWRFRLKTKLICVTGSVGKTTTTKMIASVLRQRFSVFETAENHNDEYLAPGMISRIEPEHQYAVLELGFGRNSSVSKMAAMLRPDVMVITNIGYAHIQQSGSIEATRDEKCGTEKGVGPEGHVIINGDDPLMRDYAFTHPVITYGIESDNDVYADGLFSINAKHLIYPTIASVAVGRLLRMSDEEIATGIDSFVPEKGRMDIIMCDGFTLIDSTFNASPASMKMALDTLAEYNGKRIAVLGDMLELGEYSEQLHTKVGSYVTAEKADTLIAIGEFARFTLVGQTDKRVKSKMCSTLDEGYDLIVASIAECIRAHEKCIVLCKGSHGSKIYELADRLRKAVIPVGEL